MPAHAIGSATISFGLVSIPVKLYTSATSGSVSFNFLHAKCGSRIKLQHFCPACKEVAERSDLVRGYEFSKGQYVKVSEEELKSLEGEASKIIDIAEFVPLSKVDPLYFDKAYYLGPDKGGEKAYRILTDAMRKADQVALAKFVMRGKESLVLVRAAQGGLLLHTMYFADEVRNFGEIDKGEAAKLKEGELELAVRLISELSNSEFSAADYKDEYRERVLRLVQGKVEGQEITAVPSEAPRAQVIDLMEALRASLEKKVQKGKRVAVAAGGAAVAADSSEDRAVSFAEFKSAVLDGAELELGDKDLKRSYEGLDSLRTKGQLSGAAMRAKIRRLNEDLKMVHSQPDLLQGKVKKLKAARIPLTAKDWGRY